jgi:hypothetical protein
MWSRFLVVRDLLYSRKTGWSQMTEDEWMSWNGISDKMLEYLRGTPGLGRKRRLLAVVCCHRVMRWMPVECLPAVEMAERLAEGLVDEEARWAAFVVAGESC